MPESERPPSPEEPNPDQYNVHRLEHDLFELFEEQQMLLDIVSHQQERLERQLEVQRVLMNETPVRVPTPLPELLLEEINDELPVMQLPEPEEQSEPELLDIAEEEEFNLEELLPVLQPSCCNCVPFGHQQQVNNSLIQFVSGAKCTPPKLTGLGYDVAFTYPKRMSKGRNRRALYIFTMVDKLVQQLQRCMAFDPIKVSLPLPPRPPMVIYELPKEPTAPTSLSTLFSMGGKSKFKSTSTGTRPKLKLNQIEQFSKGPKKQASTQRLRKRMRKSTLLDQEMDMDCEFGMEYISKFRANLVREDYLAAQSFDDSNRMTIVPQNIAEVTGMDLPTLATPLTAAGEQMDADELSESMSEMSIFDETKQLANKDISDWQDAGLLRPGSQLETRPCTPLLPTDELCSCHLLPAVLESNGYVNLMPSTSAQARARALSMRPQEPFSVTSSPVSPRRSPVRPYTDFTPPATPPPPYVADSRSGLPLTPFNFSFARPAHALQITPPPPPPPSPMFSNFGFGNINSLANSPFFSSKENGNIQLNPFDPRPEDFSTSGPNFRSC